MARKKTTSPKPSGKPQKQEPKEDTKAKEESKIEITEIPGQVSLERSPFKLRGKIKYLSTGIDALEKYVLEKKCVTLADAAKKFGVGKDTERTGDAYSKTTT